MNEPDSKMAPGARDRTVARGAVINSLGAVGKGLFFFVFFAIGSRLYGAATFGVFYLGYTILEVAVSMSASGFQSGVLMFASRYMPQDDKQGAMYQVLANSLVISLGLSGLLIGFAHVGGPVLIPRLFSQPGILEAVQYLSWSLPFVVITPLVIAATKAHLTMKWDAILMGLVRPILLAVLAVVFYLLDYGLQGLVLAYLFAHVGLAAVSLVVFGSYFSYAKLLRHLIDLRFSRPLLTFALPQSLNMTFTRLLTYFDVMMLGAFGLRPEMITVYGMGAQVVRSIRNLKLAFSGSFSPVIARLHEQGDAAGLSESFSKVAGWIATIGLPVILVVAVMRADLLTLFAPEYTGDTFFMLILLGVPLLVCTVDLAGNVVVMTGHSKWNLFNSFVVASLNVLLNWLLIPIYGLEGAAAASVIATASYSLMQLVEARMLVQARLQGPRIARPLIAFAFGSLPVVGAHLLGLDTALIWRIAAGVVSAGSFVAIWFGLGFWKSAGLSKAD